MCKGTQEATNKHKLFGKTETDWKDREQRIHWNMNFLCKQIIQKKKIIPISKSTWKCVYKIKWVSNTCTYVLWNGTTLKIVLHHKDCFLHF